MKTKVKTNLKNLQNVILERMLLFSIALGATYWILESFILHGGEGMVQMLAPNWHELWMRFMVIVALILFGGVAQYAISIREKAESELKESEERLGAILNTVQTGIMIIDSQSKKIVDVNPAAEDIIENSGKQIIGSTCFDYFSIEKGICPITDLGQTLDNSEYLLSNHRGEEVPVLKTATTVTLNGRKHIIESFMDITNHKKAEESLKKANQELRKTEEFRTKFLNVASHELRTPLTPMIAQLQMITQGYFGELTEEQKKSLEMVLRNTHSLNRLTEDILDISRLESETMKFIMARTDLNDVIKGAVETMRPKAEEKGINIVMRLEKGLEIVADMDRISQVIINLLNNAIKFTEEGGTIIVGMEDDENQAIIYVNDTGPGINDEDLKKIFKPFEQAITNKGRREGSGLGLAICKGIIESHGGEIWVESEQGEGSTFTFILPYNQEFKEAKAEANPFNLG